MCIRDSISPIGELKTPLSGPFNRWQTGEGGRFSERPPYLVFIYTESTLALATGRISSDQATGVVSQENIMNILALIQAKQKKAAALQSAQKTTLVYRGVPYGK